MKVHVRQTANAYVDPNTEEWLAKRVPPLATTILGDAPAHAARCPLFNAAFLAVQLSLLRGVHVRTCVSYPS